MHDSDLSSDEDEDSDDAQEDLPTPIRDGVVNFVNGRVKKSNSGTFIVRPKPSKALSPHSDKSSEHEHDDDVPKTFIVRPKPMALRSSSTLSPHTEESEVEESDYVESGAEASERVSVGARGAAFSFGESNGSGDSSEADGEDSEDEMSTRMERPAIEESDSEVEQMGEATDNVKADPPPQRSSLLEQLTEMNSTLPNLPSQRADDLRWGSTSKSKAKRVLSSNTLSALNEDAGRGTDAPKKKRVLPGQTGLSRLPELSLGLAAFDQIRPLPRDSMMRRASSVLSSDEEDLDKRLSEELDRNEIDSSRENSPVPLLTPPQSPLTIDVGEGTATMCEWPSNLAVDISLMAAACDLRPLSPASLQKFELEEEQRVSTEQTSRGSEASSLTPLLRSIYVGLF